MRSFESWMLPHSGHRGIARATAIIKTATTASVNTSSPTAESPDSPSTCRIYVETPDSAHLGPAALDGILDALRDVHLLQLTQAKSAQRYGDCGVPQCRK